MGRWPYVCHAAGDRHSGKRKIGYEVDFGRSHLHRRAMHCGFCFPLCNPEAQRPDIIELNGCRSIAACADTPISGIATGFDIVITGDTVNARSVHPSHQFVCE